jgi:polyisoprenoid-binding protein YceI
MLATLALVLTVSAAAEPSPASTAFVLDVEPNHSTVGFAVPIVAGMTRVTGKFNRFAVRIVYDPNDLGRCRVDATIDAASVQTGIDARDADLRGDEFLAVGRHPTLRFTSRRVERRADGYVAIGALAIRGVTRPLELPFRVTAVSWDEGRPRLGISARLVVDRRGYGVGTDWRHTVIPNFLGDDVSIEIDLWTKAGRPLPPAEEDKR